MSELARKLIALRWHIEEKSLDRRCSVDFGSTIEYYALRQGCVSGQLAVETVETHCQGQENCNSRDELHHTVLTQATLGKTSLIVDDKSLKENKSHIHFSTRQVTTNYCSGLGRAWSGAPAKDEG